MTGIFMQVLYVLGVVVFLVLLWRAVTWFIENRRQIRVKLEKVPEFPLEELNRHPELGQVRVRARVEHQPIIVQADPEEDESARKEPIFVPPFYAEQDEDSNKSQVDYSALFAEEKTQEDTSLSPAAPVIAPVAEPVIAPQFFAERTQASNSSTQNAAEIEQEPIPYQAQQDLFADEPITPPPARQRKSAQLTTQKINALYDKKVEPVQSVTPEPERVHTEVQEVMALYVVPLHGEFNGEALLRAILSYGLRYGDMSIFHRHEHPTGRGAVFFSMACAVEPGTFNLDTMASEAVPAVTFFMSLPGKNSLVAYDVMIDTVRRLANDLQGEVLDEQQQKLTQQLTTHYRERIQEFERRRLMTKR